MDRCRKGCFSSLLEHPLRHRYRPSPAIGRRGQGIFIFLLLFLFGLLLVSISGRPGLVRTALLFVLGLLFPELVVLPGVFGQELGILPKGLRHPAPVHLRPGFSVSVVVVNFAPAQHPLCIPLPGNIVVKMIVNAPIGKFRQPIEYRVQHILVSVFQLLVKQRRIFV